jgi:DNA-binding HxlR family transcriptional regulator
MSASKAREAGLRSSCPIAGALDIFGDRWTLLIIRDLLKNKQRYSDFEAAGESIPSNILASRLKRLEEHGIITKVAYQEHPTRYDYHLTPKGMDLQPIVQALFEWGTKYIVGTGTG